MYIIKMKDQIVNWTEQTKNGIP